MDVDTENDRVLFIKSVAQFMVSLVPILQFTIFANIESFLFLGSAQQADLSLAVVSIRPFMDFVTEFSANDSAH